MGAAVRARCGRKIPRGRGRRCESVKAICGLGFAIRNGGEVAIEIFASAGLRFAAEIIHGEDDREFLAGGAGQELAHRIALLRGQGLDLLLKRVWDLDGNRAHGAFGRL